MRWHWEENHHMHRLSALWRFFDHLENIICAVQPCKCRTSQQGEGAIGDIRRRNIDNGSLPAKFALERPSLTVSGNKMLPVSADAVNL